jgi:hypothetical protein
MPTRALIVLLVILNLGVALWWATRADPPPPVDAPLPAGVEPLRLLGEAAPGVAPPAATAAPAPTGDADAPDDAGADGAGDAVVAAADVAPAAPQAPEAPAPERCLRLGPFGDADAARAAADAVRASVLRLAVRGLPDTSRGWDVRMAGLADRAAADAMAARLVAAGFSDHYLLSPDADGRIDIALGRFSNEDGAQRQRNALREAGFEAVVLPLGDEGKLQHWLHVAIEAQADPGALRRAAGATRSARVDCATLGPAGG